MTNQTPTPEQEHPGKVALADIVAGLDSVTPESWGMFHFSGHDGVQKWDVGTTVTDCIAQKMTKADAAHVARCDRNACRSIAAYVSELEARARAYAPALEAIRRNAMPLYSCIEPGCAEEHSFRAEDLALCNEGPVCEECWAELSGEDDVAWSDLPPLIPPWAEDIAAEAARADAAEAERDRMRPWAALGEAVMEGWPEMGDIDSFSLHDWAVDAGVLQPIPGGYDPEHHCDTLCISPERGDPWFERARSPFSARAALSSQSSTGQNDGQPALSGKDGGRDEVGTCEQCSKPILPGDQYHHSGDGVDLCLDHAPMLSDVVEYLEGIVASGKGDEDRSPEEAAEDLANVRARIAEGGDRKAVHTG